MMKFRILVTVGGYKYMGTLKIVGHFYYIYSLVCMMELIILKM